MLIPNLHKALLVGCNFTQPTFQIQPPKLYTMRHIILLLTISLFVVSCGQTDTKQKELELKERELALKEKELALKYNDTASSKIPSADTSKQITKTEVASTLQLPFIGEKYFNFGGGSGTGSSITITKDGTVIIKGVPSSGAEKFGAKGEIEFKGAFKTVIKTKDGIRYKIEADKISMVDAKGNVEQGCGNLGDEPCSTTY